MTSTIESQVSSAIAEAVIHAQGQQLEIARLSNPRTTARRLREEGADTATSPMGYDQLVALALQLEAARAGGSARLAVFRDLAQEPDPISQLTLREEIFRNCGPVGEIRLEAASAAMAEEERCRRGAIHKPQLVAGLRQAAALNRWLWDHPGVEVEPFRRAAMLMAAALLDARADDLTAEAVPGREPSPRPPFRAHQTSVSTEDGPWR